MKSVCPWENCSSSSQKGREEILWCYRNITLKYFCALNNLVQFIHQAVIKKASISSCHCNSCSLQPFYLSFLQYTDTKLKDFNIQQLYHEILYSPNSFLFLKDLREKNEGSYGVQQKTLGWFDEVWASACKRAVKHLFQPLKSATVSIVRSPVTVRRPYSHATLVISRKEDRLEKNLAFQVTVASRIFTKVGPKILFTSKEASHHKAEQQTQFLCVPYSCTDGVSWAHS